MTNVFSKKSRNYPQYSRYLSHFYFETYYYDKYITVANKFGINKECCELHVNIVHNLNEKFRIKK